MIIQWNYHDTTQHPQHYYTDQVVMNWSALESGGVMPALQRMFPWFRRRRRDE